jgi:predicted O-linked N-acetylglucosamine transferase (SPINDLY family)
MTVVSLIKNALKFQESGSISSAEKQYRHICNTYPKHPDAFNLLACILMNQGKYNEAVHCIQKAIRLKSDVYFFYYHLGLIYALQKMWLKAKDAFIKALKINPLHVESYNNLGIAYRNLEQYDSVITTFIQGLEHDSSNSDIHCNLGIAYSIIGDIEKAGKHLITALKQNPCSSVYHRELAGLYQKMNQLKKAEYHLVQALKYDPECVDSMNSYAVNLKNQGKFQEAYQLLNQILEKKKDYWDVYSNKLFLLHFMPEKSPAYIFQAHVKYGQHLMSQFLQPTQSFQHHKKSKNRIGYVSPDLKCHSVAYFIESILRNHDSQTFEIYCYANVRTPDEVTKKFQALKIEWRDIYDIPDHDVIVQIKRDKIDFLIDLAGHSANNRMTLFAQKPAPIQMTYLGYPNTTGLPSFDYRITDRLADPDELIPLNTEKLLYMDPCFLCYTPQDNPTVKKRLIKSDSIIFGTFNTLAKINDHVIQVWSNILKQLPHSRLLIKNKSITDLEIQAEVQNRFQTNGIDINRLIFKAYIDNPIEHLLLYQKIDIALDTFPYNGTTTTFEALWMGIPVIGLIGQSHVSRVTYSILSALGLSDLVGQNTSEYIEKAIQLANDYSLLHHLHVHLRTMLKQSILTDGATFTRNFENLLRNSMEK